MMRSTWEFEGQFFFDGCIGGGGRSLLRNRQINIDDNFWLLANGVKVAGDSPRV
jgi:hypothetical protein